MSQKDFRITKRSSGNPSLDSPTSKRILSTFKPKNKGENKFGLVPIPIPKLGQEDETEKIISNVHSPSKTAKSARDRKFINIQDSEPNKFNEIYQRIVSDDNKYVYTNENSIEYSGNASPRLRLDGTATPLAPNSQTKKSRGIRSMEISSSILKSESYSPQKPGDKDEPYKFTPRDSKFNEIQSLRFQKAELERQNEVLNTQINEVDEFGIVLNKKVRSENFNEKRCDILKACIQKQKRYIDYLNSSMKLSKKFYKDMLQVLKFLIDIDHKYVKNRKPENPNDPENEALDVANKLLLELYREMGGSDVLKTFLREFNDAYDKFKKSNVANEEVSKVFNTNKEINEISNSLASKLNNKAQKKIKYNNNIGEFVQKYHRLFPVYTVFNDIELKEKKQFSDFLQSLVKVSAKTDEIFKKIKNFNMLKHTDFNFNDDIPSKIIDNTVNFEYYFNNSNKSKRIFLNSKEIMNVEKNLSVLLDHLIMFHNSLLLKKEDITLNTIFDLQQELRLNIERILLLGIDTTADFSTRDKIILVDPKSGGEIQSGFLKNEFTKEKNYFFQIYNEEYEFLKDFNNLKNLTNKVFDDITGIAKDLNSQDLNVNLRHLRYLLDTTHIQYHDISMVTKLKDYELSYIREYSKRIVEEMETLNAHMSDKISDIDETLNSANNSVKQLNQLVEFSFEYLGGDGKKKLDFIKDFKRITKDILDSTAKLLKKKPEGNRSEIQALDEALKVQIDKIYKDFKMNSEKMQDLHFKFVKPYK